MNIIPLPLLPSPSPSLRFGEQCGVGGGRTKEEPAPTCKASKGGERFLRNDCRRILQISYLRIPDFF